ncbi:MAG: HesB/IscA family protein, partial [Hyphomonadaceae bacterium]
MTSVTLSEAAARKIKAIATGEQGLRVAVEGGGWSGFQYEIALDAGPKTDDLVVVRDGARLFV